MTVVSCHRGNQVEEGLGRRKCSCREKKHACIMQSWPGTKRLIQTINVAVLIFNWLQDERSIIQKKRLAGPKSTTLLYFDLHPPLLSELRALKHFKSNILSQPLNVSELLGRLSFWAMCVWVCVCDHCSGTGPGAITHTYRYTGRQKAHITHTGTGRNVMRHPTHAQTHRLACAHASTHTRTYRHTV